nr:hypothetical protein CFP56_64858 [Quercus suber]
MAVQISRHVLYVIDAPSQLSALIEIIYANQKSFSSSGTIRILEGVAIGSTMSEILSLLWWWRWSTIACVYISSRLKDRGQYPHHAEVVAAGRKVVVLVGAHQLQFARIYVMGEENLTGSLEEDIAVVEGSRCRTAGVVDIQSPAGCGSLDLDSTTSQRQRCGADRVFVQVYVGMRCGDSAPRNVDQKSGKAGSLYARERRMGHAGGTRCCRGSASRYRGGDYDSVRRYRQARLSRWATLCSRSWSGISAADESRRGQRSVRSGIVVAVPLVTL